MSTRAELAAEEAEEHAAQVKRACLIDLVHEVAARTAAHAVNAGEEYQFLRLHGWSEEHIDNRLIEMTQT